MLLGVLSVAAVCTSAVYGLLGPVFPEFAKGKGTSESAVGWIFGAFALTVFLVSPHVGSTLLPWMGKKRVQVVGLWVLGLATMAFAIVPALPGGATLTIACLIIRVVQGVGAAMAETASYSLCATLFQDDLTEAIGVIELSVGMGYMVGPVFGGVLVELGGFHLPFLVVGALPLSMGCLLVYLVPNDIGTSEDSGQGGGGGGPGVPVLYLLKQPVVFICLCAVVFANSSYSFTEPILQSYVSGFVETGHSAAAVGKLFFVCSLMYALATPVIGRLAHDPPQLEDAPSSKRLLVRQSSSSALSQPHLPLRPTSPSSPSSSSSSPLLPPPRCTLGPKKVIVAGLGFISLGYFFLAPSPLISHQHGSMLMSGFAMAVIGIGQCAAMLPVLDCMLQDVANDDATNTLSGMLNSAYALGEMLGPLFGSFLDTAFGFPMATTVWGTFGSTATIMAFILFFFFRKPTYRTMPAKPQGVEGYGTI